MKKLIHWSRRIAILVGLALIIALPVAVTIHFFFLSSHIRTPAKSVAKTRVLYGPNAAAASYGIPIRLNIPEIKVDAAVDPLGVATGGAMAAPAGPKTVGWYRFGPHPGMPGSAVIDGHYGRWKDGEGSVFDNLDKLQVGDDMSIVDENGVTVTFEVRELRSLDPKTDTTNIFQSDINDHKPHLNLITCEGVWEKKTKSYSKRLVVFADKV